MTRLIPLAIGGTAMLATAFGSVATQVTGEWTLDLKTVCAVGAVVIPGTWWLSARLKSLGDQLRDAEKIFAGFEKRFDLFEKRLDELPCRHSPPQECALKKPVK